MRLLPKFNLRSTVTAVFVPTDRFFMRFIPLASDLPALEQAELALEALAPFPPTQLYWGCTVSPDRTQALVYAAHRRRFTAEETAEWDKQDLAVPALLPLLGMPPRRSGLRVLVGETSLTGAAWKDKNHWPVATLSREYGETPTEDMREQFTAELAARAELPDATAEFLSGTGRARREGDALIFEWTDTHHTVNAATITQWSDQDGLDVRDRAFLEQRRSARRQREMIWRLLLAGGVAALLALVLEVGTLAFSFVNQAQRARAVAPAPLVQKLDTAQTLNSRIEELTHRRLRFFEMVAAVNQPRPRSVQFLRTTSVNRSGLDIEAQTNTADDAGAFETALRQLPALDKVEMRDVRARDGVTTFGLAVNFKPETTSGGAQ